MNNLEQTAKNLREICSHGLAEGLGVNKPGGMCVMAAVSIASGEPFTDKPICVDLSLRALCIDLNDDSGWANDYDRAQYLTPIAIASLGTLSMDDVAEMASEIAVAHEAKRRSLLDEYEAKRRSLLDEYEAKCKLFRDEYKAKRKPFSDEYKAKRKPFLDEYTAKCRQLLIETCETLLAELIRLETPGSKFLYLLEGK